MSEATNRESLVDLDYSTFKRRVKSAYGLDLEAYKRPQMERRLRANMEKAGAQTFVQYFGLLQKDAKLADEFLDRVTINVTELFRNPEQFELLRTKVFPDLKKRFGKINVWSAGCSMGAEPYTLAILLDEMDPNAGHNILATDIDDRMLEKAKRGMYQEHDMKNVSVARKQRYFDKMPDGILARNGLKKMIEFKKHDMLHERFRTGLHLILCRNVVIYFTDETKRKLYEGFFNSLTPGGYLFVGGTERIADHDEIGYENPYPFFYRKPERH